MIDTTSLPSPSSSVRSGLGHPVIDADGHTVEFLPALATYLERAGAEMDTGSGKLELDRLLPGVMGTGGETWFSLSPGERARRRVIRGPWWGLPAENTRDLATVTIPRLLYERLDEFGIDYSVVYGSLAPGFAFVDDPAFRRAACRGANQYHADMFGPLSDRLTPAAVIPMHTPDEAIAELRYAVEELGYKVAVIAGYVKRPIEALAESGRAVAGVTCWLDTFGIDSPYDYDEFWACAEQLGVPLSSHAGGIGWGSRQSISSYMYNHVGHFAAAGEALCKSLFFGGVTRRFPSLRFAFLEGGVAWAASLYCDLVGHWDKRNAAVLGRYDPDRVDRALLAELLGEYGSDLPNRTPAGYLGVGWGGEPVPEPERDEWAACGIAARSDFTDRFVNPFFFGCEADDPMTAVAFSDNLLPMGARLNAVFSSDVGHWDVPDCRDVLSEAYEAVEEGRLGPDHFRDLVFVNPARFLTGMNPDFFKGTAVEAAVRELMGSTAGG